MTKDFALTAALGAIELHLLHHVPGCVYLESVLPAIRAALAQTQEPVAWMMPENKRNGYNMRTIIEGKKKPPIGEWKPLYTASPKREWVGLTDDDIALHDLSNYIFVVRLVEEILKERNHD